MPPDPPRWLRAYGARFSRADGATDLSDKTKSLSAKLSDKLQMLVLLTGTKQYTTTKHDPRA